MALVVIWRVFFSVAVFFIVKAVVLVMLLVDYLSQSVKPQCAGCDVEGGGVCDAFGVGVLVWFFFFTPFKTLSTEHVH